VNARATLANLAWLTASIPAHRRFVRALHEPAAAQARWLRAHLSRNADTAYVRAHGGGRISNYAEFARRMPIVEYSDLEPWIRRIMKGDQQVLVREPVIRLVPTSGSTGARKLIPFTASLQREFNTAIAPWMIDLTARAPSIALGPAYWSITPMGGNEKGNESESAVPIGFDDDSDYLGGARAWLVQAAMAVPSSVRHLTDLESFRRAVLVRLLRCADLRLISVWHPSFLSLLLDTLIRDWDWLMVEVARFAPHRAAALRAANPEQPSTIWRHLHVVSAWADAHARAPAEELRRRLPGVTLQPKGLLATEGCITLPFSGQHPVALGSHFFEFLDEAGSIHPVEDLRAGRIYEVVITTGGGLWRYRLGDRVEVSGFVGRTPSLRFLSRSGNISDRCGEKLSEAFVTQVLARLHPLAPFAMLAPERVNDVWRYTLFLVDETSLSLDTASAKLDESLNANPHYALCRRLGQLDAPRVTLVDGNAYERFSTAEVARGRRLGDIKPVALSQRTDWAEHLAAPPTVQTRSHIWLP
jgi:hypothetical protein